MATAYFSEYVEFVGSGGTLLLGSRGLWSPNLAPLVQVGPSVGGNLPTDGADGTVERQRKRGELSVALVNSGSSGPPGGLIVDGSFDEDNAAVAAGSRRAQALTTVRKVNGFFDDFCTGRTFTVRLTMDGTQWEADGQLDEIGLWQWLTPTFAIGGLLFTVNDGLLSETTP